MKYVLVALALVGALLVGACAPFGGDPTPVPNVAALETQAAAQRAVNDARATWNAPYPTDPPATQTWYANRIRDLHATTTAIVDGMNNDIATMTALPSPTP